MARARRIPAGLGAAAWGLTLLAAAWPAAAQSRLEYSVKANYLVRFAAFVEWPPRVFSTPQAPVVICVVGRDPFGAALDTAARAQTAYGRPLAVRRPANAAAMAGCHIVYAGQGGGTAAAAAGQPGVLLVTDGAASDRGAVHFVLSEGRVRFHIDQQAAARNGLTISSRLLNLALSVRGG
ncbi:YfiR family protein [Brevundimonas sp.]|uniref:YfiR family protein n=1 Tax=Brevundimonas sp. TaxID=1871086 RepID=UPI002C16E427|nr:YfiR family protein [Brevundimonas sp.]HWQ88246.1 YfiR family protein [Brevundimonas sp.]